MRVYIGPYEKHYSTYKLYCKWISFNHKKDYYDVNDEDLTKIDKLVDRGCDLIQAVLNATINKFNAWRGRKIKVRIDRYDTWGMDHTLALIILPMLKQIHNTKFGSPLIDDEDVPEHLRSTSAPPKKNDWDTDDLFHSRWEWVLNEMIWTFEQIANEDAEDQFYSGEEGSKFDRAAFKVWNDRINNGTRLFGKYFRGLWD